MKAKKSVKVAKKKGKSCPTTTKRAKTIIAINKGKKNLNTGEEIKIVAQKPQKTLDKSSFQNYEIQCWAHTKKGERCKTHVKSREGEPVAIPYCQRHMNSGDGALKVVHHPIAGKCLVARYDLPAKYRMAFYGFRGKCLPCDKEDRAISFYPPDKVTGRNREKDGSVKSNNYNGVLNPGGSGDILQFASCPGPNERQNVRSTFQYWGLRNGKVGGLEFITLEKIKKDTQLCHWYGAGWWRERNLKRIDVGTEKYPAPLRKSVLASKENKKKG